VASARSTASKAITKPASAAMSSPITTINSLLRDSGRNASATLRGLADFAQAAHERHALQHYRYDEH
jgi:hypothetical protein